MSRQSFRAALIAATILAAGAGAAKAADAIPYTCCGYNATTYTFTASATGDLIGYFAGASAADTDYVGVLDNGVLTAAGYGLDNQTSTVGQSFNFGDVHAGDTLVFVLYNESIGKYAYSDPSMNGSYDAGPATGTLDGHNHIYSTAYTATSPLFGSIPQGTYVAFEDLPFPGSDYDYNDEQFVFTDVTTGVPEPGVWAMLLMGVGAIGAAVRANRRNAPTSVAA